MTGRISKLAAVALFTCATTFAACDDDPEPPRDGGVTDTGADVPKTDTGGTVDTGTDTGAVDTGTDTKTDAGVDGAGEVGGDVIGASSDAFIPFDTAGNDVTPNPAMAITGSATATDAGGGKMRLTLNVAGLPPNRSFGSHLHQLSCEMMSGGGHYQHNPFPADGGSATDPTYANPINEAWLDFTTDATGAASSSTVVNWVPAAPKAKAIIVHLNVTGDGGVAGPRLACLPFTFL